MEKDNSSPCVVDSNSRVGKNGYNMLKTNIQWVINLIMGHFSLIEFCVKKNKKKIHPGSKFKFPDVRLRICSIHTPISIIHTPMKYRYFLLSIYRYFDIFPYISIIKSRYFFNIFQIKWIRKIIKWNWADWVHKATPLSVLAKLFLLLKF